MEKFFHFLNQFSSISNEASRSIINVSRQLSFPKRHILIPNLALGENLYFIESGLARAFFYHNSKEVTDWFGMEGMVIGPIIRRFPSKDTLHQVELLEDSTLIAISFSDLEMLYKEFHSIERIGRMIAINTILAIQKKLDHLQLLNASERYSAFLQEFPNVAHRIPLQYLASYLGMNQVTLSKIRRNRQHGQ